jgi:deazaflavin-dependent oxidoreductase (nitroreductase family)
MNAAVKRLMRAGNGLAVFLYRRSNGRLGGSARGGTPVLLLTVPGRKTGTPHTTPVSYFEDEGGYVVTGTAGGTKQDPQWFRNLRAASRAHVELGPRHLDVDVHVASGRSATVSGARSSWPGHRPSPRTRRSQGV